ncbi:MAG: hypothetical protein JSV32_02570 [Dehalococcoidia bacterium]|nr:MAG: hypothetical protein JSV32_02570 [Dehalococcoidia bacterium]
MKSLLFIVLVVFLATLNASNLPPEVENQTAILQIQGSKYTAQIYAYFKNAKIMTKLHLEADTTLCSPIEFGYYMGNFEAFLLPVFAQQIYAGTHGKEASGQFDWHDVKTMRTPFEKAAIEFSFEITEEGLTYEVLVREGSKETITKDFMTWKTLYE